jgi:hypothetical protein
MRESWYTFTHSVKRTFTYGTKYFDSTADNKTHINDYISRWSDLNITQHSVIILGPGHVRSEWKPNVPTF